MPPGSSTWSAIPSSPLDGNGIPIGPGLATQSGQTEVTSPGDKAGSFSFNNGTGGSGGGAGDGSPVLGAHPSFTLENLRPTGFLPRVGGMDFLPDGRLAISTWDSMGAVYLVSNLNAPGGATFTRYAEGLGEPLGLKVVNGFIYVAQKQEVTKLLDTDNDGTADEYESVAHGWPMSFNYHEFTFNLVYKDGYFWVTTSTPLKSGDTSYLPDNHNPQVVP